MSKNFNAINRQIQASSPRQTFPEEIARSILLNNLQNKLTKSIFHLEFIENMY
jgi:hypothetical protein